jgi:DHA3 family macrolide efflux protein-like MFS transporter
MLNGGLNVISAPLGALLLGALPIQGILIIDVATALMAILPLIFIVIPQPESIERGQQQHKYQSSLWQDFKVGFRYLLGWRGLMIISLMTVGINFTIIPAFSLLPLMVKDYFGGDALQLGWVESAMGIGVVAGGALLGAWGGFERKILTSMLGLISMGVGTLILAIAPASALFLAIGGAFLIGASNPITMGPFFAVLQSTVEPDMQARLFSLLWSIGSVMTPIGLMVAGPVADQFGIQTWFMVGGVLCVLMGLAGSMIPDVMNIEARSKDLVNQRQIALAQTIMK